MDALKVPYAWGWAAKSLLLLLFIGFMFYRSEFMTGTWVADLLQTAVQDVTHLLQGRLEAISAQSRTLLFVIGWTLMISVTQALMLQRQHSLWFIGATLLYLIGLQLALSADTTLGIIRTLVYGLLLLAMLNLSRIEASYGLRMSRSAGALTWMFASAVIIGLLAVGGLYAASAVESKAMMKPLDIGHLSDSLLSLYDDNEAFQGAAAKSGYGQDDSVLGGPLQADNTVVFTAKSSEKTYWRGESKSLYDGKGWTQAEPEWEPYSSGAVNAGVAVHTSGTTVTQEVLLDSNSYGRQLFVGGGLEHIQLLVSDRDKPISDEQVLISTTSGKIKLPEMSAPLSYYKVTVSPPNAEPSVLQADTGSYPEDITNTYLQLPAQLPRTVRKLAEDITEGSATPYAKAAAIEQYLRNHYTYSLDKPTRPAKTEDFVSHFLFVDQIGYCDHFSTAMTVMLRAVGVPARWVKGYAPGTEISAAKDGMHEFTVTNKDAHSWVEVYFPQTGWVPFEPTPGFYGSEESSSRMALAKPDAVSQQGVSSEQKRGSTFKESLQSQLYDVKQLLVSNWRQWSIGAAGILLLFAIALMVKWASVSNRFGKLAKQTGVRVSPAQPLIRLMDRLWQQLFRKHGRITSEQTLREYVSALTLDNDNQKDALLQFALVYETMRYAPSQPVNYSKAEIMRLWKAIQSREQRTKSS
ncbi:transglutaminase family protein [Paenibacillus hexagrammi]